MHFSISAPCFNADGGGGGGAAPIASPFTAGGQTRGGGRPGQTQVQGSDPITPDMLQEMYDEIHAANARAEQAAQKAGGLENVLGGLREALGGEKQQEAEADWYEDQLLPHLLALEKDGKSHPMIATLARELRKSQEQQKQAAALYAQLQARLDQTQDPVAQNNERAYSQIDDFITEEITSVYGENKPTMHRAIAANIAQDLKRVQAEFPSEWEKIRRDPAKLHRIVQHHVAGIVPPRARQALAAQVEANTPVTLQTVEQAWQEFQSIKDQLDPQLRSEMATELRRQLLTHRFAQGRRLPARR